MTGTKSNYVSEWKTVSDNSLLEIMPEFLIDWIIRGSNEQGRGIDEYTIEPKHNPLAAYFQKLGIKTDRQVGCSVIEYIRVTNSGARYVYRSLSPRDHYETDSETKLNRVEQILVGDSVKLERIVREELVKVEEKYNDPTRFLEKDSNFGMFEPVFDLPEQRRH